MKSNKKNILKTADNFASLTTIGVFWANAKGEIIKLNNSLLSLLGFSDFNHALEVYNGSIYNLFYDKELSTKIFSELIHSHLPSIKRCKILNSDHSIVNVSINIEELPIEKEIILAGYVNVVSENGSTKEYSEVSGLDMHKFMGNLQDFFYIKDIDGQLVKANQTFLDIMEIKNIEQLNSYFHYLDEQSFYATLHQADLKFIEQAANADIISVKPYSEIEVSEERYFIKRISLTGTDNTLRAILVHGIDFQELKIAEKTIIDHHTNLEAILESARNSICLINIDKKFVITNARLKTFVFEFFGKEISENQNALDFLPQKLQNEWEKYFNLALGGSTYLGEFSLIKDSKEYHFELIINPVVDTRAIVVGITVFISEITERKNAEDAIKENEVRFRQLAENTIDALVLSNKDGIIYVNPAFEKLLGISCNLTDIKSDIIEQSLHIDDREQYVKNKNLLLNEAISIQGQQCRLIDKKGDVHLIWIRSFPITNRKEIFYRNLTVISDLTEQSELRDAISNSQLQQKAILDNIPYLAWLKDDKGKYISVNEPFANFFHKSQVEIIGRTDHEIFTEPIAARNEQFDMNVKDAGRKQLKEEKWETDDGLKWIETFSTPIFSGEGNLIGITGISHDISDRKLMEETIIENEEHFRSLLQYSSDAITIIDSEGLIVFESSLRNRISDFMIDELIGRPYSDIIHPDDIYLFDDILERILNEPEIQIKREYRSLHKNKKWIYVESIFSNHLINPSIKGIVVNTRDVSDRKMSELKERVYHENLIFLSNSALDLLGISDRENIFKYIADKLYNFLEDAIVIVASYSEQEGCFKISQIRGQEKYLDKINELVGIDFSVIKYGVGNAILSLENAGNVTIYSNSIDDLKLDNYPVEGIISALKMIRVNKIYNISMARDNKLLGNISILTLNKTIIKFKHIIETFVHQVSVALHRSQLEFELIQAKTKAEESDMLKTAFLANMSHEIRTPMNGILGFAEMLNDDNITESNRKKYVEIINNNGKMLMSLIDDIIDFSKIEAGQIKILKQEFSLNTLLSQVHSSFLSESLKKDKTEVKLRIRKALSNEECFIQTDPNRLRQILTNLVGNSFKFTQEGYIEFGYKLPENGFIEFYVKDTGIGISPEKIDQVFERFVQADYSRSRKYSGSGLGLAISRGFVELLGGKMWATSEVNVGSVFSFTIPYIPAVSKTQEEIEKKKPKSEYDWNGKCFLVAEDDKFSFKLLEGFLKKTNAVILHAEDGLQAIEICKKNESIDLILMDVQMPEMNGMEATKNIKQFRKSLPIIAQTANAIAEERQRCFEAGFDDFVTKPINITELFFKIDKWLTSK